MFMRGEDGKLEYSLQIKQNCWDTGFGKLCVKLISNGRVRKIIVTHKI